MALIECRDQMKPLHVICLLALFFPSGLFADEVTLNTNATVYSAKGERIGMLAKGTTVTVLGVEAEKTKVGYRSQRGEEVEAAFEGFIDSSVLGVDSEKKAEPEVAGRFAPGARCRRSGVDYCELSYSYSIATKKQRIVKPWVAFYVIIEGKNTMRTLIGSAAGAKVWSLAQVEVDASTVKNVRARERRPSPRRGKIIAWRLELWQAGAVMDSYETPTREILERLGIPDGWHLRPAGEFLSN